MAKLGLVAPWDEYYEELNELFRKDYGVKVVFDEEAKEIKVYVADPNKAAALSELLPSEKNFGGQKLLITIVPANGTETSFNKLKSGAGSSRSDLLRAAFKDNEIVSYFWDAESMIPGLEFFYVVFNNVVVQYYSDNLANPHGLTSTLYENIARDVFNNIPSVFYCTDVPEDEFA